MSKLVVANWKLNGGLKQNKARFEAMVKSLNDLHHIDIAVCVPYPYLFQAQQCLSTSNIHWGSQNVSQFEQGAYTSCVSAEMVAEFGSHFAILGHSERRFYNDEGSHKAVLRIQRAAEEGITPIYCIGETLEEHQAGQAKAVIDRQMQPLFEMGADAFNAVKKVNMVIAYEPVWAIGSDQAATPEQVQTMHAYIREHMKKLDAKFAKKLRIIYGGSLNPQNAKGIFDMPDIDGGLVGRASLDIASFKQICEAA